MYKKEKLSRVQQNDNREVLLRQKSLIMLNKDLLLNRFVLLNVIVFPIIFANYIILATQQFAQCCSVSPESSVSSVINDPVCCLISSRLYHSFQKPSDQFSPVNYSSNKNQTRFADIRSMDLLKHFVDEEKTTTARRKVMFSNSPLKALNACVGVSVGDFCLLLRK